MEPISVGDCIDWGVYLVDGHADGWPSSVLVDAVIGPSPEPGAIIVESTLSACRFSLDWDEEVDGPIPARRTVLAGLRADWFLPPKRSVTGIVRSVQTVSRQYETKLAGPEERKELEPVSGWQLADVETSPRRLGPIHGWRKVVVFGSTEQDETGKLRPGRTKDGHPDIVSSSLQFEGPEPGQGFVTEATGLLLHVELSSPLAAY